MSEPKPKRCAIYIRISLDRSAKEPARGEGGLDRSGKEPRRGEGGRLGVQRQKEDCLKQLKALGWTLGEVYEDNDISASKNVRRPEYERLMSDIKARGVDGLVVYDLDRLTRKPIELERFMTLADEVNLPLKNVSGDVDLTTGNGRMMARIKGAVARQESDRIGERVSRRALQRAEGGVAMKGRWRYFGFTKDFQQIPEEVERLRDAYARYLRGESLQAICNDWNARGLPTVTGKVWRRSTLSQSLDKPFYAGLAIYRGEENGVAGTWEPVISVSTFRRYQELRVNATRDVGGQFAKIHLLSGIALCGRCGNKLRSTGDSYDCIKSDLGCGRLRRKREPLERLVEELLLRDLEGGHLRKAQASDVRDYSAEIAEARAKVDAYQAAHESGDLELQDFMRFVKPARGALRAVMAASAAQVIVDEVFAEQAPRQVWATANVSQKRAMLRRRIRSVVVQPVPEARQGSRTFDPELITPIWND